jgi:two-component system, sensor histidine kinase LadS
VVSFAAVGPVFYFWRVRRLEARQAAQELFARQLIDSQEQERKRIAAELHDSLGQDLLVIKNRAALALAQRDQPHQMAAQIQEVSAMASAAIREVRSIAQNLRPFQIDELGLTKSIASMLRALGDSTSIRFQAELCEIDGALPPELEINFYRIVQECLNNIVKHSQARTATVQLYLEAGSLRLMISDDGRGFDPATISGATSGGFGLSNIAERARSLGGELLLRSRVGEGTRVEVVVPLQPAAKKSQEVIRVDRRSIWANVKHKSNDNASSDRHRG